jgi:hypothetical protein
VYIPLMEFQTSVSSSAVIHTAIGTTLPTNRGMLRWITWTISAGRGEGSPRLPQRATDSRIFPTKPKVWAGISTLEHVRLTPKTALARVLYQMNASTGARKNMVSEQAVRGNLSSLADEQEPGAVRASRSTQ